MLTTSLRRASAFIALSSVLLIGWVESPAFRASEDSQVRFECFGPNIVKAAKGRFASVVTSLVIDPQDLTQASGSATVPLTSVVTDDPTWDILFRAAPFLSIEEYPTSRFELTAVEGARKLTPGKPLDLTIIGNFTLRDVTKPVRFPARVAWTPRSSKGPEVIRATGQIKITWKEFGVRIPAGAAAGFAGEGTTVDFDLAFERKHPRSSQKAP